MKELDHASHAEVVRLSEAGDNLVEKGDFTNALDRYWEAFDILPEPKNAWEAGTWILVAIGDCHFLSGNFKAGMELLTDTMHYPEAIGNPFIHLRLGQCHFELGNLDKAADELTRSYAIEGEEIFNSEDPKYWEFLKTKLALSGS